MPFLQPGDIWVATSNGSAFVSWDEPVFADNVRVDRVINKGGLKPGQVKTNVNPVFNKLEIYGNKTQSWLDLISYRMCHYDY